MPQHRPPELPPTRFVLMSPSHLSTNLTVLSFFFFLESSPSPFSSPCPPFVLASSRKEKKLHVVSRDLVAKSSWGERRAIGGHASRELRLERKRSGGMKPNLRSQESGTYPTTVSPSRASYTLSGPLPFGFPFGLWAKSCPSRDSEALRPLPKRATELVHESLKQRHLSTCLACQAAAAAASHRFYRNTVNLGREPS